MNNHSFRLILLMLAPAALLPALALPLHAEEKPAARDRIAVVNFIANNTESGIASGVRNSVEINLFKDGSFDILEQSQMDVILRERKHQAMECRDERCAARLGRLLKADYVIIGSVDRLGAFTINVKVVRVKDGTILISESGDAKEIGGLKPAADDLSRRIAARIKRKGGGGGLKYPVCLYTDFIFAVPVGYLGGMAKQGYGALLGVRICDLGVPGLNCGVDGRFIYLQGKGKMLHAMLAPFLAGLNYTYTIWKISFTAGAEGGGCYSLNYYYADRFRYWKVRRSGIQPMLAAGVSIDFILARNVFIGIGSEYNIIFERGGDVSFVSCQAGLGVRF
jgi:hypothetical protein